MCKVMLKSRWLPMEEGKKWFAFEKGQDGNFMGFGIINSLFLELSDAQSVATLCSTFILLSFSSQVRHLQSFYKKIIILKGQIHRRYTEARPGQESRNKGSGQERNEQKAKIKDESGSQPGGCGRRKCGQWQTAFEPSVSANNQKCPIPL